MLSMLLSIVIPVYNNPTALSECLASFLVRRELLEAVEFVVVDDGSEVEPQVPQEPFVRMIRRSHNGASAARNAGIEAARGRFVWFFDADDCVDIDDFSLLLSELQSLPPDAELFHTGPMQNGIREKQKGHVSQRTCRTSAAEIFVPRSGCLDHTTYLVNRQLLLSHAGLRYPEGRSLLEDSVFVLSLFDIVQVVFRNESLRPYCRVASRRSLTAGGWTPDQCRRWLPDIEFFFEVLGRFVENHPDFPQLGALHRRYCYLYLRVLAVKGCPWMLLRGFRNRLRTVGYRPDSCKERLFFNVPFLYLLSTVCRLMR